MDWLPRILEFTQGLVAMALTLLAAYIGKKMRDGSIAKEATEALFTETISTYEGFVKDIKKKSDDGKLTKDEAIDAMKLTLGNTLKMSKGPALKLLLKWGEPKMKSLVESFIVKMKGKK